MAQQFKLGNSTTTRGWDSCIYAVHYNLSLGYNKGQVNLKYSSWSTVKPLYLFDVLGQGQSKIIAKMSTIIRSMHAVIKNFSVKILTADKYNVCAIFVATHSHLCC